MDRQEAFYERELDRTPYGACVMVALLLVLIFAVGVISLWKAAGVWKHHVKLPTAQVHVPQASSDVFGNIQQEISDQAKAKAQAAATAAASAAVDAAKQEAQQQVNSTKEQYQQYLNK